MSRYQGTKALRRSCRKVLEAHPDTWKDLEAEEHQGPGELAGPGGGGAAGRSSGGAAGRSREWFYSSQL